MFYFYNESGLCGLWDDFIEVTLVKHNTDTDTGSMSIGLALCTGELKIIQEHKDNINAKRLTFEQFQPMPL